VAATPVASTGGFGNALTMLIQYIPTEVLSLYIATVAARDALAMVTPWLTPMVLYWTYVVATPLLFMLLFTSALSKAGKPLPSLGTIPWWKIIASTVAFGTWALAIPDSPYVEGPAAAAVAGLGAIVVSTMLDVITPIAERIFPQPQQV
jgi:hypothetical protein